jgi:hypothetical protein
VSLLAACAPQAARPVRVAPTPVKANVTARPSGQRPAAADVSAIFTREFTHLPTLSVASGRGWSAQVPGRNISVKAGTVENSDEIRFDFEDSGPVECTVFEGAFDSARYVAAVTEELKKSVELVAITPTRFAVEQEFPVYFVSVFYRKATADATVAGQCKLALGLHRSRPIVCMHDVPGYTESFEKGARAIFGSYHVDDEKLPIAVSIGVAHVGTLPIGFSHESVEQLDDGRTEYTSITAQIVPRSATDLLISDDLEVTIVAKSQLVEGRYVGADLRGEKMNLTLQRSRGEEYRVSGTVDEKPIAATLRAKQGLPGPDATSTRLKQQFQSHRPFSFTQAEYHPGLDPTGVIPVSYSRTQADPIDVMHVGLGQLELTATVDEQGEERRSEIKAGSQTILFERIYHRDDRTGRMAPSRMKARQP